MKKNFCKKTANINGFTLLEIVVVLVLLGVGASMLKGVYGFFSETDKRFQQVENSLMVKESLETYLATNSRLPCPDDPNNPDGVENLKAGAGGSMVCTFSKGSLPFQDLAIERFDAWGNDYFYAINTETGDVDLANENRACHAASVFGKTGAVNLDNLFICPVNNAAYCDKTPLGIGVGCSLNCGGLLNLCRSASNYQYYESTKAPYFGLSTPPVGTNLLPIDVLNIFNLMTDKGNLSLLNQGDFLQGLNKGEKIGVVAVAISWGANGASVNQNHCVENQLPIDEYENCDGDSIYVNMRAATSNNQTDNRDYVIPITMSQAKTAIIRSGKIR
ncbi:putative Prepilin-type N-terminal cleavage/methylation domain-containing protein [uncultured Thiomicrorhabdus sp.]